MPLPPDFFDKVYAVVRQIPYGRVSSYGAIANYVGVGRAARMVGWAMSSSHGAEPFVPAHRVVNRNGQLTGKHHFAGPDLMQEMLENEGVEVENDQVVNFKKLLWNPEVELNRTDFDI